MEEAVQLRVHVTSETRKLCTGPDKNLDMLLPSTHSLINTYRATAGPANYSRFLDTVRCVCSGEPCESEDCVV